MAEGKIIRGFGPTIQYDIVNMLLGEELGVGSSRRVFANELDPLSVVKVAHRYTGCSHANVLEWETWKLLEELDSPLKEFFAPCLYISPNANVLVMSRTQPCHSYPAWVPKVFSDLKLSNFGCLPDGRFVCHDYGLLNLEQGFKMHFKKAAWWSHEDFGPNPVR